MTTNPPMLTIITPAYNRDFCIYNAIRSIFDQDYESWESIVVDDGSSDETGRLLDDACAADGRVTTVHQTNRGVSAARNAGLSGATGQYILFLDSDDAYLPQAFTYLDSELQANQQLDMIIYESTRIKSTIESTLLLYRDDIRRTYLSGLIGVEPKRSNRNYRSSVCNKCVRHSIIEDNNLIFDEKKPTWEDGEYAIKLIDRCNQILMSKHAVIEERTVEHDDHLSCRYYPGSSNDMLEAYLWINEYYSKEFNLKTKYFFNYHFERIQRCLWRTMSIDKNRKHIVMSTLQSDAFAELVSSRDCEGAFESLVALMLKLKLYTCAYYLYILQNWKNRGAFE